MYIVYVCVMCTLITQLLQNDLEVTKVGLDEVLPAATIMVVSVTASTTQGYVHVRVCCTVYLQDAWNTQSKHLQSPAYWAGSLLTKPPRQLSSLCIT